VLGANDKNHDLLDRRIDEFAVIHSCVDIIQILKNDDRRKFKVGLDYEILYHQPIISEWLLQPDSPSFIHI
jgi:hypothetical protein